MFLQEIPEGIFTTTLVKIQYDCDGGFERCGKEWTLKYKDAKENFDKNNQKHICRKCWLKNNNPAKKREVQEKMKQTNMERYGATCALNTKENIDKRVEKMFGTEESTKEIVTKRKTTNIERYGVDHPMKNEEIKIKQQNVLLDKYGFIAPLQNPEILAKTKKTNMEKYGVENVCQVPEIRVKMAKTTLERYGVEHYNQLPEMKDYLRENCKEWLADSYANPWAKGITRPEEWNQKQSETMARLITSGEWNGGGWKNALKGHYQSSKCKKNNPYFRSSLELMVHFYLDNEETVEFYDYEPFSIVYKDDDGNPRRYIPDFIVKYVNSLNMVIIEVKPNYMLEVKETQSKIKSAIDLCKKEENIEFVIWGKEKIHSLGYKLEDLLENELVTLAS